MINGENNSQKNRKNPISKRNHLKGQILNEMIEQIIFKLAFILFSKNIFVNFRKKKSKN